MSTPPPHAPEPSSEPVPGPTSDPAAESTPQRRHQPKRNLTGVGFALLGGYFAYNLWSIQMSWLLKAPLLLVFAGVAVYGLVQLWQNRRR